MEAQTSNPNPTTNPISSPASPPLPKSKNWFTIFLFFLIIVSTTVAIYFSYQNTLIKQKQQNQTTASPTPLSSPIAFPAPNFQGIAY